MPEAIATSDKTGLSVLIVDDERDFARGLTRLIAGRFKGLRVDMAHSGTEALAMLGSQEYHLMLTDLRMPELSGMDLHGPAA